MRSNKYNIRRSVLIITPVYKYSCPDYRWISAIECRSVLKSTYLELYMKINYLSKCNVLQIKSAQSQQLTSKIFKHEIYEH